MLGLRLARLGLLIRLLAPAGALTFFGATSALAEVVAAGPAPDTAQACPSKAEALAGVELPAEAGGCVAIVSFRDGLAPEAGIAAVERGGPRVRFSLDLVGAAAVTVPGTVALMHEAAGAALGAEQVRCLIEDSAALLGGTAPYQHIAGASDDEVREGIVNAPAPSAAAADPERSTVVVSCPVVAVALCGATTSSVSPVCTARYAITAAATAPSIPASTNQRLRELPPRINASTSMS